MPTLAETSQGESWAEKYLHPPSVQNTAMGITPDNNMSPVVLLNFETIDDIPLRFSTDGIEYAAHDVCFLQGSGARVINYVFVRHPQLQGGNWFQHPNYAAIVNDSYDFNSSWGRDASMSIMSYKSCTYYLNATAFSDQGTVTSAQFRPSIYNIVAAADTIQSRVLRSPGSEFAHNAQQISIGNVSGGAFSGAYVPSTATQILQSNPKATANLAKLGAFVPQKWSQPTNRFYNVNDFNGSDFDLDYCYIDFGKSDGSFSGLPLFVKWDTGSISKPPVVDLQHCGDTAWSDFTWAYVMFTALGATLDSNLASPYITVKSIYGIEVQPYSKSAWTFFQQDPPIPDDRAIHSVQAIAHQTPDAYPASANDFGTILSLAAKYVPKVIDWLSNANDKQPAPKKEKKIEKKIEKQVEKKVEKKIEKQIEPRKNLPNSNYSDLINKRNNAASMRMRASNYSRPMQPHRRVRTANNNQRTMMPPQHPPRSMPRMGTSTHRRY